MVYRSLRDCVDDLERHGQLLRIPDEVDPYLEMAFIHREVYGRGGPAIFFENVKGSPFPAVSNLFGTEARTAFIFRHTLSRTKAAIQIKADPIYALKNFWKFWHAPVTGLLSLPKKTRSLPVLKNETTIDKLPQIQCWLKDGGAFVTLPQVYTEDPSSPHVMNSNIGMYRVQLAGNNYVKSREVGLHYQIHRGIGVHHQRAIQLGKPLPVAIFVGGPPAHTFAAVMPLPEGLPEVVFAGMLAGRRFRYGKYQDWTVAGDADFCILGTVEGSDTKPEGPFGDHLGYYSLKHDFPVLKVQKVFHRDGAIWPFTVVGRPPQEDTQFGHFIHELTKPMVPVSLPGVHAMHAVDVAGVHPLLLAIGSERYTPYLSDDRPAELLTQSHGILGFNQASLAKYLFIISKEDAPQLDITDVKGFFHHVLERVDFRRDLHFHTKTTMDTLDYSGEGLNFGSKLVIAARGAKKRTLASSLMHLGLLKFKGSLVTPGIAVCHMTPFVSYEQTEQEISERNHTWNGLDDVPLIVLVDDADFAAKSFENWLWVTFTRSDPARDIYGVQSFVKQKHWGCDGSLIIDARIKPHHAPPLEDPPELVSKIHQKFASLFQSILKDGV